MESNNRNPTEEDLELADVLVAISVVAKLLAKNLQTENMTTEEP